MTTKSKTIAVKGRQISVSLENEPGALSSVTSLIGAKGINIHALTLTGGIDHGFVRMVVDHHDEAIRHLSKAGYLVFGRDVVLLEIQNEPGELSRITAKWAKAGLNLEYAYCAGGPTFGHGLVVVSINDADKAVRILKK